MTKFIKPAAFVSLVFFLIFTNCIVCLAETPVLYAEEGYSLREVQKDRKVKKGLKREGGKLYYYENGKRLRNRWRNVKCPDGKVRRFYFTQTGAACTGVLVYRGNTYVFNRYGRMCASCGNRLFQVGNYFYCPMKDGKCIKKSWVRAGGKLYYATSTGRIARNMTIEGVTFKNSRPVMNAAYRYRELCIRTFRAITKAGMSKEAKLKACWNYMVSSRFSYILRYDPNRSNPLWMRRKAYEMLMTHGGDCVSFACAFAGLAAEAGYRPVIIYGRVPGSRDHAPDGFTTHCWVKIDGKYYDPEAHFAGWRMNVYGMKYYPIAYQVRNTYSYRTGKVLS